jgi:hypothetical protein
MSGKPKKRLSFAPKGAKVAEFKVEEPVAKGITRTGSDELRTTEGHMGSRYVPSIPPEDYRRYVKVEDANREQGFVPMYPLSREENAATGPRWVGLRPAIQRTDADIPATTTQPATGFPWGKGRTRRRSTKKRTTRKKRSQKKWTSSGTRRRN